jgi:PAS domain-containing protein
MNRRDSELDSSAELLSDIGQALASSLEADVIITLVAQRLVPALCDICVIDLTAPGGAIREAAVAAREEASALRLEELRERHPIDPAGAHPVARAIRSGEPVTLDSLSEQDLAAVAQSQEHMAFIREQRYSSGYVVPLRCTGQTLGAISMISTGERAPLDTSGKVVAGDIARTLSLAIEKARLFDQLRRTERFLQAVLAGLSQAVTVVGPDGRIVFANQAAAELFDFASPAELSAAQSAEIDRRVEFYDPAGARVALEEMPCRRLLRGEEAGRALVRVLLRGSLRERWVRIAVTPVYDEQPRAEGEDRYLVSVIEDVSELVRSGPLAQSASSVA